MGSQSSIQQVKASGLSEKYTKMKTEAVLRFLFTKKPTFFEINNRNMQFKTAVVIHKFVSQLISEVKQVHTLRLLPPYIDSLY